MTPRTRAPEDLTVGNYTWLPGLAATALLVFGTTVSGCGSDATSAPPPAGPTCTEGSSLGPDGECVADACPETDRLDAESGACKRLGWTDCPEGFTADESGHGCRDVAADTCEAGTRPSLGQTICAPVGIASCASGFAPDRSGWGCRAVLPSSLCTGATRESLGSVACAAVGSCSGAFPPAGATVFVDPAFTNGELDANHFRGIGAALTAAPANATIAVAAGTYTESLAPTKSVRLVGRCAGQVTLASPGGALAGVHLTGTAKVVIEGMTIRGHQLGVHVTAGAEVTLRDVIVDENRGQGMHVSGYAAKATLERSVVRRSSTLNTGTHRGVGIEVQTLSELVMIDSVLASNEDVGLLVQGRDARAVLERSAIVRTRPNASGYYGQGAIVRAGATLEATASAFVGNSAGGLALFGDTTQMSLTDVVVSDTSDGESDDDLGRGVVVDAGKATLLRVTSARNHDAGLFAGRGGQILVTDSVAVGTATSRHLVSGAGAIAFTGGKITLRNTALVANTSAAAVALKSGSALDIEGSLLADSHPDADGERGHGVILEEEGTAALVDSTILDNRVAGVIARDAGSRLSLTGTLLRGTQPDSLGRQGRGIGMEGGATADVRRSAFVANHDIGVWVQGPGSTATLEDTVVRGTLPDARPKVGGLGMEAASGGAIDARRLSLVDNHGSAVVAINGGSAISLVDAWIADTGPGDIHGAGRGLTVQGDATLTALGVIIERSLQVGAIAAGGGRLELQSSSVDATTATEGGFGHGVLAFESALIVLKDVKVSTSEGTGLAFAASRASVNRVRVTQNSVGVHVQDGSTLVEATTAPADPPEGSVIISSDSTFDGNATRLGAGTLPLPEL